MSNPWVNFDLLRRHVSIATVLQHYKIDWLRESGNELHGRCPIHQGEGTRSFHVNVGRNVFHCFSCGAGGGTLELVASLEGCGIRQAALKLDEWFGIPKARDPSSQLDRQQEHPAHIEESINRPLSFRLRVNPGHPYGSKRGLSTETIEFFEAGLCVSNGMFSGRYVVPLHDETGQLVGYMGRSIDGSEPKYLLPSGKKGFRKSRLLFNLHRLLAERPRPHWAVLVEGIFDAMRVRQAGYPSVALLGSSLSRDQEALLCQHFRLVVLLFDGDAAGRRATAECKGRLRDNLLLESIELPDGKQPDMLDADDLHRLLESYR